MNKKVVYYTDEQLKGINHLSKVIDFGVSLTVNTAINELYNAHMILRERKDLFNHDVKKWANIAYDKANNMKWKMMGTMRSKEFFDAYINKVIDLTEDDIAMLRINIKQTLDNFKYKDSNVISFVETARILLDMACVHFEESVNYARETIAPFDYTSAFSEFYCKDVLTAWGRACDILYKHAPDIDLNTKNSTSISNSIARKFADGDYIHECMTEAHRVCPDFVENMIKVTDNT